MNAGMGDTHNLGQSEEAFWFPRTSTNTTIAWKIVYVLRGWSPLSILETVCIDDPYSPAVSTSFLTPFVSMNPRGANSLKTSSISTSGGQRSSATSRLAQDSSKTDSLRSSFSGAAGSPLPNCMIIYLNRFSSNKNPSLLALVVRSRKL